tara:strand:+ start:537 stop:692 length:156 start_codon:yes stop_codon:yes gene_type:complete
VTVKTYIIETTILLIIVLGILWCGVKATTGLSKETKRHSTPNVENKLNRRK